MSLARPGYCFRFLRNITKSIILSQDSSCSFRKGLFGNSYCFRKIISYRIAPKTPLLSARNNCNCCLLVVLVEGMFKKMPAIFVF